MLAQEWTCLHGHRVDLPPSWLVQLAYGQHTLPCGQADVGTGQTTVQIRLCKLTIGQFVTKLMVKQVQLFRNC